ncbi:hypothetical protein [Bacillus benzoevorans]|uniref:Uncharacterized protein n=1 Tax=Bacillus benzoevorans TaxID=1456 RepID=A0A7X0LWH3_9BACI|nr:hypothetical protein [Bacillus benzoevorans]MBB6445349.1 hypothetical protein [Bacillus benzoevorans]
MKKIVFLFTLICLLLGNITSVGALTLENKDNPTSFTVKILPWDEANKVIPKKSIFTIIDVETGLHFEVQRRAGSKHADVQPLTFKDTKMMKTIYNGKWSWKRRAILIATKDQLLAASMHGMPHGAGALKNGFPGHFCVHFYGSTTHGSGNEDLSHKIMILRAGGKLADYLNEIEPVQVLKVFETAVNQRDNETVRMLFSNKEKQLHKRLKNIMFFSMNRKSVQIDNEHNPFIQRISVDATVYHCDFSKQRKSMDIILLKDSLTGQWRIDGSIADQL